CRVHWPREVRDLRPATRPPGDDLGFDVGVVGPGLSGQAEAIERAARESRLAVLHRGAPAGLHRHALGNLDDHGVGGAGGVGGVGRRGDLPGCTGQGQRVTDPRLLVHHLDVVAVVDRANRVGEERLPAERGDGVVAHPVVVDGSGPLDVTVPHDAARGGVTDDRVSERVHRAVGRQRELDGHLGVAARRGLAELQPRRVPGDGGEDAVALDRYSQSAAHHASWWLGRYSHWGWPETVTSVVLDAWSEPGLPLSAGSCMTLRMM